MFREIYHAIMLFDFKLCSPSVNEKHDLCTEKGVVDYLSGKAQWEETGCVRSMVLPTVDSASMVVEDGVKTGK